MPVSLTIFARHGILPRVSLLRPKKRQPKPSQAASTPDAARRWIIRMLDREFWSAYFKSYDILLRVIPYQELHRRMGELLALPPGSMVLDAGAGTGNTPFLLRDHSWRFVCLDVTHEGLRRVAKKDPKAMAVASDLQHPLPFPDRLFDGVYSSNVLFDVVQEHREQVVQEWFRVLKPGGTIVIHNVLIGFRAQAIYREHLIRALADRGLAAMLGEAIRFLAPTLRLLWMNREISRNPALPATGDQAALLTKGGFTNVRSENGVYAKQGEICIGMKPSERNG
jgi:ubiquinone/menaquinone biosynthesis C-methylase UbiE